MYKIPGLTPLAVIFSLVFIGSSAMAQQVIKTLHVDQNPVAVGVNPSTNLIYVANMNTDDVTVIDGITFQTTNVMVGEAPSMWR
jgi:YVTN family beta-propeller protein